jgi:glutathione S-transferase
MLLATRRAAHPRAPTRRALPRARLAPCRYTSSDPRGDRFAETVLFTATDDGAGGGGLTPASQSVMIALLEKRIPFRHVLVRHDAPAGANDDESGLAEFRELYSAANPAAPPRPSPPLLADCGTIVAGASSSSSRVLLEYLCERYRAVGTPLIPSNAAAAATMRLFVDVFSESVVAPFRRFLLVPSGDKTALARAKGDFFEGWRRIDAFLLAHAHGAAAGFDALDAGAEMLYGQHRAFVVRPMPSRQQQAAVEEAEEQRGEMDEEEEEGTLDGRPPFAASDPIVDRDVPPAPRPPSPSSLQGAYLLGRAYSLAEVATTPHVARMAALLPAMRGVELVEALRAQGLERAAAWCEACLARPSAVATDPTADELVGGLAAAEWARV